jgi:isopentenyldiphosphate isomerase
MNENDELLQVYNESGDMIEPLPRSVVHSKPVKYWHGVVNVWLVNNAGELMVSKRSGYVSSNPGKWQTYFGGHVSAGMTHIKTAVKELEEEVGLKIDSTDLYLIDKGQFANDDHLHFYESYAYLFNGSPEELEFSDGEISEARWMQMSEYQQARTDHPEQWCNACNEENQNRIKYWLKELYN